MHMFGLPCTFACPVYPLPVLGAGSHEQSTAWHALYCLPHLLSDAYECIELLLQ